MTKRARKKGDSAGGKGKRKTGFFPKYRGEIILGSIAGILLVVIYILASGILTKKETPAPSTLAKTAQKEKHAGLPVSGPRKTAPQKPDDKPASKSASAVPTLTATPAPAFSPKGKIAIIIDDLGLDMEPAERLARTGAPIAFSVLPHLKHSRDVAEMAHREGFIVMSHLPMEAKREALNPGPGGLLTSQSEKDMEKTVLDDFNSTPHISGVNNHMGSLFTEDRAKMEAVMREIKRRNFFFVDSKTSPASVGMVVAAKFHVPSAARDVFLDNERDKEKIVDQIISLAKLAVRRGKAVGIGHPYPETIDAIGEAIPKLKEMGVEVAPVTELLSADGSGKNE